MTRVIVLVPSASEVKADFAVSLATLFAYSAGQGISLGLLNLKSSLIVPARNDLVRRGLTAEPDYVLFLDSDMIFPANALCRLLAHQKDVVGASYSRRTPPYGPLGLYETPLGQLKGGLVEAKVLPTGVMLIRADLFRTMKSPWFRQTFDPAYASERDPDGTLGEDYHFSVDARAAGFSLWCDVDLTFEIGHVGEQAVKLGPGV